MLHKAKSLADLLLELFHRQLRFKMIFEEQTGNPKTLSILDFKRSMLQPWHYTT